MSKTRLFMFETRLILLKTRLIMLKACPTCPTHPRTRPTRPTTRLTRPAMHLTRPINIITCPINLQQLPMHPSIPSMQFQTLTLSSPNYSPSCCPHSARYAWWWWRLFAWFWFWCLSQGGRNANKGSIGRVLVGRERALVWWSHRGRVCNNCSLVAFPCKTPFPIPNPSHNTWSDPQSLQILQTILEAMPNQPALQTILEAVPIINILQTILEVILNQIPNQSQSTNSPSGDTWRGSKSINILQTILEAIQINQAILKAIPIILQRHNWSDPQTITIFPHSLLQWPPPLDPNSWPNGVILFDSESKTVPLSLHRPKFWFLERPWTNSNSSLFQLHIHVSIAFVHLPPSLGTNSQPNQIILFDPGSNHVALSFHRSEFRFA